MSDWYPPLPKPMAKNGRTFVFDAEAAFKAATLAVIGLTSTWKYKFQESDRKEIIAEAVAKIWKSMIPTLSEEDASVLADKYAFSGGNIENIARKSTVEYVLSGNEPTLSSLEGYCQEEILDKKENRNRIGF